jgi:hypothetical protein
VISMVAPPPQSSAARKREDYNVGLGFFIRG